MAFESLTNETIRDLLNSPKQLINPQARNKDKNGHNQLNYMVIALDNSGHKFEIYKRQNLREFMENDFSCGINWVAPNGETLTLVRYNGPSHEHLNFLEKERLEYICHIHRATEKYIRANRKPEGFATATDKYQTLEGAFHCLITDCNVRGIKTNPDILSQTKLF